MEERKTGLSHLELLLKTALLEWLAKQAKLNFYLGVEGTPGKLWKVTSHHWPLLLLLWRKCFFFFFSVTKRHCITSLRKWGKAMSSEATIIPVCNSSRKAKNRKTSKTIDPKSQQLCESRFLLYFGFGFRFYFIFLRQCLTLQSMLTWES